MSALHDRIEGVLLGTAAGDALGAAYEFEPPRGPELPVAMTASRYWELGEWTDDTAMAVAIAEVAATGADLRAAAAQDAVVSRWYEWSSAAKDVGIQTGQILRECAADGTPSAARARAAARRLHERTGRTGGNGSLMRTAPVALAYLDDEEAMVAAARAISDLTHPDPDAGDAVVLWCSAIRHAVLDAKLDIRVGLDHLPADRRAVWLQRIEDAEQARPADFPNNGWVVEALQAAWSAITLTAASAERFAAEHLRHGLEAAVRCGNDTDTVAAIAGGLLGAAYGASAVPLQWRRVLHGWPGYTARDLVRLANAVAGSSLPEPDYTGFRTGTLVPHPHDPGVLLGGYDAVRELPAGVTAVVSLCRVGGVCLPDGTAHVEVRLIDTSSPQENPHLDYVLLETASTVEQLRAEGHTVLVHCVEAYSRTPTVAALYGARRRGIDTATALRDVLAVLPHAEPNPAFRDALRRLDHIAGPGADR